MFMYKRLIGGAALAVSSVALMTAPAFAQTFSSGPLTTYATQAVAGSSGAITVPAENIAFLTPTTSTTMASTAGSFLLTYTLPAGVTFTITPTVNIAATTGALCTPLSNVTPSGGGNTFNTAVFTISTLAVAASSPGSCTVTLNAFTLAGATALQTANTTAGSGLSTGFVIKEQVSASTGTVPTFNQATAATTGLANSVNALSFLASGQVAATINVLPPSNGTKITQTGTGTNVALANLGTLTTALTPAQNSTATAPFTFTGTSLGVSITGNFTGANGIYIGAGPAAAACAATFAARPTGAIVGAISGNTATFTGVASNFASGATAAEVCIYYNGTTIIGQNPNVGNPSPAIGSLGATGTVDTTSVSVSLAAETYNGVVQQIAYTGNNGSYPNFVRIVNNTAGSIQVFAVVQGDGGSTGQAQVESALAANSNDLVAASTIIATAGVTALNNRASMILLAPFGTVIENLLINPNGTVVQMGSGTSP